MAYDRESRLAIGVQSLHHVMNRLCRPRDKFEQISVVNSSRIAVRGEYLVDHPNCTYFPLVVSRSLVIKAVRLFQSGHKGVLLARFQTF